MCRIQNSSLVSDSHGEFPLADLTALFQPTKDTEIRGKVASYMDMSKRIPVESLSEKEYESLVAGKGEGKTFSIYNRISGDVTPESAAGAPTSGATTPLSAEDNPASSPLPHKTSPHKQQQSDSGSKVDDDSNSSSAAPARQSCDPILEVEEPSAVSLRRNRSATLTSQSLLERRTSLQPGGSSVVASGVSLIHPAGSGGSQQSPIRSREHSGTPPPPPAVTTGTPSPIGMRPRSQLQHQVRQH